MNEDDDNLDEEATFEEQYDDIEQAAAPDSDAPVDDDPEFDPEVEGTTGLEADE